MLAVVSCRLDVAAGNCATLELLSVLEDEKWYVRLAAVKAVVRLQRIRYLSIL
jgi:hypothetical protein